MNTWEQDELEKLKQAIIYKSIIDSENTERIGLEMDKSKLDKWLSEKLTGKYHVSVQAFIIKLQLYTVFAPPEGIVNILKETSGPKEPYEEVRLFSKDLLSKIESGEFI